MLSNLHTAGALGHISDLVYTWGLLATQVTGFENILSWFMFAFQHNVKFCAQTPTLHFFLP